VSGGCDACGIPPDLHDPDELAACRRELRALERRERAEDRRELDGDYLEDDV